MIFITMKNLTSIEIQPLLQEANESMTKINHITECVFAISEKEISEKIIQLGEIMKTYLAHAQCIETEFINPDPVTTSNEIIDESTLS